MEDKNIPVDEIEINAEEIKMVSGGAGEPKRIAYYECGLDGCTRKYPYDPDDPESEREAWHKYCVHLGTHRDL